MTEPRTVRFVQADVFTDTAFGGNPLAVVPEAADLTEEEMQKVAREMNLSETAFVLPGQPGEPVRLRLFTPAREIPFAGHPVIGTLFVLAHERRLELSEPVTPVSYRTEAGVYEAWIEVRDGDPDRVRMGLPPPKFFQFLPSTSDLAQIAAALSLGRSQLDARLPVQAATTGLPVLIVPIRSLTGMREIHPRVPIIEELCAGIGVHGLIAFSRMTVREDSTIHARMFAPALGILEDPATGSAAGALGSYLVRNGVVKEGPIARITIEQGFEMDRPSTIEVEVEREDDGIKQVRVAGRVVIVAEGSLRF